MAAEFAVLGDPVRVKGRGVVVPVKNPGGYPDPTVLTGTQVIIDGRELTVRGVERFLIALPYPDSLDFGFLFSDDEWGWCREFCECPDCERARPSYEEVD